MSGLYTKLISGTSTRKSRLHDEDGVHIRSEVFFRNFPRALFSATLRILFSRRSRIPWISYDAIELIDSILSKQHTVALEFGSGMSTTWLAKRKKSLTSVEDNSVWSVKVQDEMRASGISNVSYVVSEDLTHYVKDLITPANYRKYNFILIDGPKRDECVAALEYLLAPNGVVYLDNSDKKDCQYSGNVPEAKAALRRFARERCLSVVEFTDFAPGQLFVHTGILVKPER